MAQTLSKKLVLITIAASNPDVVAKFYESFFGVTLAQSLTDQEVSYHGTIDENGIDISIGPKHNAQETVIPHYAVADLTSAVNDAKAAGGKVLWGPAPLPVAPAELNDYKALVEKHYPADAKATSAAEWNSIGQAVLVGDPAGCAVGLVQLAPHARGRFNAEAPHALTDVQVAVHTDSVALGKKHAARVGTK